VKSGPVAAAGSPASGAVLTLRNVRSGAVTQISASGEGVFRAFPLTPGDYLLDVHADGFSDFAAGSLTLHGNEVLTLEISARRLPRAENSPPAVIANSAIGWIRTRATP